MARMKEIESVRRVKAAEPIKTPRGSKYDEIFSQIGKLGKDQTALITASSQVLKSPALHRQLRHRISMAVRRKFPGSNFDIFMTEDGVAVRYLG